MSESIGNASPTQLLMMLGALLGGMLLLIALLIFSFTRRQRKDKMKLGLDIPSEADNQIAATEIDSVLPTPLTEDNLNLGLLGKLGPEVSTMSETPLPDEEKVDLAARLGVASEQPAESAAIDFTPPAATTSVPASVVPEGEAVELLRFLRHPETGKLLVGVGGQSYSKLADVDDKDVGQYILELAAHLLAFTNGVVATDEGLKSVYVPKVNEVPALPVKTPPVKFTPVSQLPDPDDFTPEEPDAEPLVPPPPPEAQAAFLASLQATASPEPPAQKGMGIGFFGPRTAKSPAESLSQFNLAAEINKFVQARLVVSPLASTTKIEILSDPNGGIQIKVNGQVYAGPDDIVDVEVRTLIKESIKQWERS